MSPPPCPAVLFCPADRPDRYDKALSRADVLIVDLEDAVAPERKQAAREMLRDVIHLLPPERTVVRINPPSTEEGLADLEMLADSALRFLMLPKTEAAGDVEELAPWRIIALCETARGVQAADSIAAVENCVALMWGGEDLTADLGGWSSRRADGGYLPHVTYARSRILLAAGAAGVQAWDGVYHAIEDLDGLRAESADAVAMGFAAKVAIHPAQVPEIRAAYRPTEVQEGWAARLLATVALDGAGVSSFEGRMVDGPLIAMAERIAARSMAADNDEN
ncbi:HpcH/HpaI aldolase/citrate lyase family protein [Nocardioides alcanivorans]|uniref:HpcH/HpaI aldolase/citrate lyase family protein n=1 Tax=Nocardioides alcanivorans TaxID=2897352 RepID=UPI001F2A2A80|nr:CoA ester lyase [Nocardioides alcanivorans]